MVASTGFRQTRDIGDAKWSDHFLFNILHALTDFVGEDLADALEVPTDSHAVGLHVSASDFRDELVEEGVVVPEDV